MRQQKASWTVAQLKDAVSNSKSLRSVIIKLSLVPAGGNYRIIQRKILEHGISTSHFLGKGWSKGLVGIGRAQRSLEEILQKGSNFQSYKLKHRLFAASLKARKCELCGWAKTTEDGYLPLELDHINGDSNDNRIDNLRILCPNCHSLQKTHRGRNKKHARVV